MTTKKGYKRFTMPIVSTILLTSSIVMTTFTALATQVVNEISLKWEHSNSVYNGELANAQISMNQNNGRIDPDLTKREGSNKRQFEIWTKNGDVENNKSVQCIRTSEIDNDYRKFDCTYIMENDNSVVSLANTSTFKVPVRANYVSGGDKNIRLKVVDDANNRTTEIVKPITERTGVNLRYNRSTPDSGLPNDSSPVIEGLEKVGSSLYRVARLGTMHSISLANGSRKDVTRVEYDAWTQDYHGVAGRMERFLNAKAYDYNEWKAKGNNATPLSSVQIQPYSTNPSSPDRFKFKVIWDPTKVRWNGNHLLPVGAEYEGPYIVANYAMPNKASLPSFATPGQSVSFGVALKTGNIKLTYSDGTVSRTDFNTQDNVRKFVVPPNGGYTHHTFPYNEYMSRANNTIDWTYYLPTASVNAGEAMQVINAWDPKKWVGSSATNFQGYGSTNNFYSDTYFTEKRDFYGGVVQINSLEYNLGNGDFDVYYTQHPCTLDGTQWRRNTTDGVNRNRTSPKVNLCGKANGFDVTGNPQTGWKKIDDLNALSNDNFYSKLYTTRDKEEHNKYRFPSKQDAVVTDVTGIRVVYKNNVLTKMKEIPNSLYENFITVVSDRNISGGSYIGSWNSFNFGQPREHTPLCQWGPNPSDSVCNKNQNTPFRGEWWGSSADVEQIRSVTSEISGMNGLQLSPNEHFNIRFNPTIPGQSQRGITTSTLKLFIPAGISIDTANITVNGTPYQGEVRRVSGNISTEQQYELVTKEFNSEDSFVSIPAVNTVHSTQNREWSITHRISGAGVNANNKRVGQGRALIDGNVSSWSSNFIASTVYTANMSITNKYPALVAQDGYYNAWNIKVDKNYGESPEFKNDTTDTITIIPHSKDGVSRLSPTSKIEIRNVDVNNTVGTNKVYYTTVDPTTINPDPAHSSNQLNGGIWSLTKPADGTKITGVRVIVDPENKTGKTYHTIHYNLIYPLDKDVLHPISVSRVANSPLKIYTENTVPVVGTIEPVKPKVVGNIKIAKMSSVSIGTGDNKLLGGSTFRLKEISSQGTSTRGADAIEKCAGDTTDCSGGKPPVEKPFDRTVTDDDNNGLLDFTDVPRGKMFELIETKSPNGYSPLPERILFNITDDGQVVLVGKQYSVSVTQDGDSLYNATKGARLVVFDTPSGVLPNTGYDTVIWLIAFAGVVSSVGVTARKRLML